MAQLIELTDLTGLCGIALALASLSSLALSTLAPSALTAARRLWAAGAIFVLLLLPLGELPPAAYVRGMTGDLSITSLLLLGLLLARGTHAWPTDNPRRIAALLLLLVAACVLYPLALGALPYDSYRWGYAEPLFLGLLLALALAAALLRLPLVALAIALGVLAWAVGWYESENLWDYLLDPLLSIYALIACLLAILRQLRASVSR